MPVLDLRIPASAQAIAEVRAAVADAARDAGITDVWPVRVCVSEAVTNAVKYGSRGIPGAHISVSTATPKPGTLRVTVSDQGHGFRPGEQSDGLGLGLPLIAKLASRIDVWSGEQGGAVVFMEFTEAELRARTD